MNLAYGLVIDLFFGNTTRISYLFRKFINLFDSIIENRINPWDLEKA